MTKKLYIETVGCQMNVLDSELLTREADQEKVPVKTPFSEEPRNDPKT